MANSVIELPLIKSFIISLLRSINFIEVIFSETPLKLFLLFLREVSLSFLYNYYPGQYCMAGGFCSEMVFLCREGLVGFFCIVYF